MKLPMRGDRGAALGMVLIFVSIFSLWLSATMLLSQTAAAAVARAQSANTEASAAATLTTKVLSQLENATLQTGLPNQPDCGISVPSETLDGTVFSVECAPAADGTFATTIRDSIILIGTDGVVGTSQGIRNGGTTSQTITITNIDGGSTSGNSSDMRNNGGTASSGNIVLDGTARVKNSIDCTTTGTTGLVAKKCENGADKSDITQGATKDFWTALKEPRVKATTAPTTLTSRCTNGSLTTTQYQVQTGVSKAGAPIMTTYTVRTMTLLPGIYGSAEIATLQSITSSTTSTTNVCGRDWITGDIQHIYFSPGSYTFRGTNAWTINNPKVDITGRLFQTDGTLTPCTRPADKAGFDDVELQNSPDGFEITFEESARIVLQAGDIDMCPTSYQLLPRHSVIADTGYTGTADVIRMVPSTGATPSFTAYGMVFAPASSLYFVASNANSVRLLGGVTAKAVTIIPPTGTTNYQLNTGAQKTPGERYVTVTVKATKNGTTKTVSKTTIRVKDSYGQNKDSTGKSRPKGYEIRKSSLR